MDTGKGNEDRRLAVVTGASVDALVTDLATTEGVDERRRSRISRPQELWPRCIAATRSQAQGRRSDEVDRIERREIEFRDHRDGCIEVVMKPPSERTY